MNKKAISTLAGGSSFSIEPIFSVAYTRNVLDDSFTVVDPLFEKMIKKTNLDYDKIIKLVTGKESIQDIIEIPKEIRELFVTAHDISPEQHVKMVATFQNEIDTGVSKTVNLPSNATIEKVDEILKMAYDEGCKGITVFRDGCRKAPITTEKKTEIDSRAPDITYGVTQRIAVSCGHFLCNVSGIDDQPLKIINNATTGCCDANLHALQRIISLALRLGVSPALITEQLDKVICSACTHSDRATSKSCAAGMSSVIKLYDTFIENKDKYNTRIGVPATYSIGSENNIVCPECGKESKSYTKCFTCIHCGFSKCS
jgi:ribonucleoside-diphosphate reductase alpha chain